VDYRLILIMEGGTPSPGGVVSRRGRRRRGLQYMIFHLCTLVLQPSFA